MRKPRSICARAVALFTGLFFIAASAAICPQVVQAETLDFEDIPLLQVYDLNPGTPGDPDSFVTNGIPVQLAEFFLFPSGSTTEGATIVENDIIDPFLGAGGSGQFMFMGNVNLDFDFGGPLTDLSFLFGEFGGNLNIEVNGVRENVGSLFVLPVSIGGVGVVVDSLGTVVAGELGRVTLTGNITSFSVGGQEFSIDDVQFTRVPEPTSISLMAMAMVACLASIWRRGGNELAA